MRLGRQCWMDLATFIAEASPSVCSSLQKNVGPKNRRVGKRGEPPGEAFGFPLSQSHSSRASAAEPFRAGLDQPECARQGAAAATRSFQFAPQAEPLKPFAD